MCASLQLHKLQCAQNSLSRVVLPLHHGLSSSRLSHLHWLLVHRRIQFKIALITYKTLSTDQPPYLRNLLNPYRPSRSLRSANRNLLLIPSHTTNFSRRAFSFAACTVWNKLPTGIRESNTLHIFKHRLKTLFTSGASKGTLGDAKCVTEILGGKIRKLGGTKFKIVATRCHVLRLKCTKFDFGWGSVPDPAGGAPSAPPRPRS